MKIIIQIPCFNEEETLPITLADLPKSIPGVDEIEVLIVNDGSEDRTLAVAREWGVDHVVNFQSNRGLAYAWRAGIDAALRAGADIIVNTNGDNQYCGADIPKLVRPVLEGRADMVIGERPIDDIEHFSWLKKRLQRLGSAVVSLFAGTRIPDAASGFRAYSRETAFALDVISSFDHCMETTIRAARQGIKIETVPIRVNEKLRESHLFTTIPQYLRQQSVEIFRIFTMVRPLKVFSVASLLLLLPGLAGFARFLVFYFSGGGKGHVQSLLFSAALVIVAFVVGMIGLAADMISGNRRLIEQVMYRLKKIEIEGSPPYPQRSVSLDKHHDDGSQCTPEPALSTGDTEENEGQKA